VVGLQSIRYDYDDNALGARLESLLGANSPSHHQSGRSYFFVTTGGNHFRFWAQTATGAYFLAVSYEEWAGESHNVEPNGFDIGRLSGGSRTLSLS
jgi:hypothetical protein